MMLTIISVTLFALTRQNSSLVECSTFSQFEEYHPFPGYYYDLEPFIYTRNGSAVGMVVDFFDELTKLAKTCFNSSGSKFVHFNERLNTKEEFEKKFLDYFSTNTTNLNVSQVGYWFPIMGDQSPRNLTNYLRLDVLTVDSIAYIKRRDTSHIFYKIGHSWHLMDIFLTFTFLTAILFGILFWMAETFNNPRFSRSFMLGSGSGIWLAFVSMTSVGYGDVAQRNPIGRFLGIVWMTFGLIASSVITGTMTEALNGVDINVMEVAALNGSFEAELMKSDNFQTIKLYNNYDEIVRALQQNEVPLAIMNSDVAAYKQDTWNDGVEEENSIVVVKAVHREVPITIGVYQLLPNPLHLHCLDGFTEKARNFVKYKHRRKLKISPTYAPEITELIQSNTVLFYGTIGGAALFALIAICEISVLIGKYHIKKRREKNCEDGVVEKNEKVKEEEIVLVSVPEEDLLAIKEEMKLIEKELIETLKRGGSLKMKNSFKGGDIRKPSRKPSKKM